MPRFGAVSPKEVIAKAEANDSGLKDVDLSGNALFKMKAGTYGAALAAALAVAPATRKLKLLSRPGEKRLRSCYSRRCGRRKTQTCYTFDRAMTQSKQGWQNRRRVRAAPEAKAEDEVEGGGHPHQRPSNTNTNRKSTKVS